jgi:ABC-type cobalamin transport system ATPase subunit
MTIGFVGVWIVAAVGCVRVVWSGGSWQRARMRIRMFEGRKVDDHAGQILIYDEYEKNFM